jgi:hypothetical protein
MLQAGAAMQEIRGATDLYVVFSQGKPLFAGLVQAAFIAKPL